LGGAYESREPAIIFFVRADPEPQDSIGSVDADRTMRQTNAHGPVRANALEVKRWMMRIGFQQLIVVASELLNLRCEIFKSAPKRFDA